MENENNNNERDTKKTYFHSIESVKEYSNKLMEKFSNAMEVYEKSVTNPSYTERLDYTVAAIFP